ncbi:MAG: DUF1844 domain-containing protein [Blastocatellia bacterium]
MSEREDTRIKVIDRRKFNPDGSPREATEPQVEPEPQPRATTSEQVSDNVVSFPSEASRKQPESPPVPEPAPSPDARAAAPTPPQEPSTDATPTPARPSADQVEQAYNQAGGARSARLPEPSFFGLVNMLAVEAAMHLGLIQSPGEEAPPLDPEAARHLIDMLGMIQTKTRGNLTPEEESLLENILGDLRMQFVAFSKRR